MHLVGLTGGIATGKTYVLKVFEELGAFTLRADLLARSIIFAADSPIRQEIVSVFGADIYDERNGLIKEEFSRQLFEDGDKRRFINSIVHPLVAEERRKKIQEVEEMKIFDFFIYESALLVEAGTYRDFERIVVVYCSPEDQLTRLMERDRMTRREAEQRIQAQFPLREKLKVADYTIDTSGNYEQVRARTCEVFHLLRRDCGLAG